MSHLDHPAYRPDIDGLRAFAVLAVVGFHAFPELIPGGFAGVDVFFVISGFLITSIILKGLASDSFSFSEFYGRRIRRIFPALLLVLATVLAAGYFLLLADEYRQLAAHEIAGVFFFANIALWKEVGYFDTSAEFKPLLHLWSLGIEEQFYLLWPLLLGVFWKKHRWIPAGIAGLLLLSFLLNLAGIHNQPSATFFLPHTRFWELLAGAWLAGYGHFPGRTRPDGSSIRNRNIASLAGGACLLVAAFGLNRTLPYPGYLALFPVAGAALLIWAGPDAWLNRHILSRPVLLFFGLISYPLYLWHWPLLAFPRIIEGGEPDLLVRMAAVAMAMLLAWLTYRYLEPKLRFHPSKWTPAVLLTVGLGLALAAQYIKSHEGLDQRFAFVRNAELQFRQSPSESNGCKARLDFQTGHCLVSNSPDASKTLLIIGDSHARSLAQGFDTTSAALAGKYHFLSLGQAGCLPFKGINRVTREERKSCIKPTESLLEIVKTDPSIDTVIIVSRYSIYFTGTGFGPNERHPVLLQSVQGGFGEQGNPQLFEQGLRQTLDDLQQSGKRVIFMHQVPELGFSPRHCVTRPFGSKLEDADCTIDKQQVEERQAGYRQAVASVLANYPDVLVFDPLDYFCHDTLCQAMRGKQLLYRDDDHLNRYGADFLMQNLMEWLSRQPAPRTKPG